MFLVPIPIKVTQESGVGSGLGSGWYSVLLAFLASIFLTIGSDRCRDYCLGKRFSPKLTETPSLQGIA
jgi:hypothetical protein